MRHVLNVGDKLSAWTVKEVVFEAGRKKYLCQCQCGFRTTHTASVLVTGKSSMCKSCRNKINAKARATDHVSTQKAIYGSYMRNALNRGLDFNLSFEEFIVLIDSNCIYCDTPPSNVRKPAGKGLGDYYYSGVDRVDNLIGYEIGNVVPACQNCNFGKRTMSQRDFLDWIEKVYNKSVRK